MCCLRTDRFRVPAEKTAPMTDERELVELASAAIEEAARTLPPLPLPVIDATVAGFAPVPARVEVTYTPYDPCADGWHCPGCTTDNAVTGGFDLDCCRCGAKWVPGTGWAEPSRPA
jgi:hypothetical protein